MNIELEMDWIMINMKSVLIYVFVYLFFNCLFVDNVNYMIYDFVFKVMIFCVKCSILILYFFIWFCKVV